MASKTTVFMKGRVFWAKVLGDPRPNYNGDAREWSFEFEPDEDGLKALKDHKLLDRLKNKYEDRGKYLTLKKKEFDYEGRPNKPIRIYDSEDADWDQNKLIGNGTEVDLKLDIRDYGPGKKKGVYPQAIRIQSLVEYQSSEFGGMPGRAKPEKAPVDKASKDEQFRKDFDLDDEIPL